MSAQPFDPAQYKAAQRQDWGSVAAGWKQWWKTMERGAQAVSDRLVELAGIQAGQRVLDVATGIGEPAVTAARRVGPTGQVVATDQAPQMLAIARERAASLGLQNIEFREMDAEVLDLPASSFDVVLCRWGLMFLPNLATALERMYRLLAPGGRLAAAVWSTPPNVPLISIAMGTVRQLLQAPPPPPGIPGPFSLSEVSILEQALAKAGFSQIRSERLTVTFEWASAEDYTRFQQAIAAPINAMLADQPAERQASIWRAVTEAAQQHAVTGGAVRLANEAICVAARR
ncbi:MAG: methyltransferase domain-containing protein [Nitrospirae bacterium]|nr:methyltransferase domain-containing protein [Nitrospirota bacterium]